MDLAQLIKDLGLPVALVIYLVIQDARRASKMDDRIEKLETERYGAEVKRSDRITAVVERNTIALNGLNGTLGERPCLHGSQPLEGGK